MAPVKTVRERERETDRETEKDREREIYEVRDISRGIPNWKMIASTVHIRGAENVDRTCVGRYVGRGIYREKEIG